MAAIFAFVCPSCGELHEGSPSFAMEAPSPYLEQTEAVQQAGELAPDWCWYEDEDGVHRFVRVCLEIPIHGIEEPFLWGVWVSLSQESFQRYMDTYDDPDPQDGWFGWLCNYLPGYPNTYALKARVRPQVAGDRPIIELENSDHPLAMDYHQGISIARAQALAEQVMHP